MRKLNKRKLNKPRSKQAIASDLSKRAKKTLKNTKKNVKIWKKNPRRIDIEGVDTPRRKAKCTSKPKTVRSKVVKKVKPVIKGKVISTKKVNSSIRQKKPKERKSTMEELKTEETKLMRLIKELSEHRANHKDDVAGYIKRRDAATKQQEVVRKIKDKIRESKQKMMPSVPGSAQYSPSHVRTAKEVAVDRAHAKMRQDTEAWEKKHDSD